MVKLNLIVEGGVYPNHVSAETASNVESLRQSLHQFFQRLLRRDDIEITIFMGAGFRNAAKQFVEASSFLGLFVDSDLPPEKRYEWFDKLTNQAHPELSITMPEEKMHDVFFMIQEMEAWFLKQPACLDRWATLEGYSRKDAELVISDHSLIKGKDIERIAKPSEKLALLMKRFFEKGTKAARYGKLKQSPLLLDSLDVEALLPLDAELQRFVSVIDEHFARFPLHGSIIK